MKAIETVLSQVQHQQVTPVVSQMGPRSKITERLYFLFHGVQGTGKSLAAKCLANYARRPLFIVSSGMKAGEATFISCLRTVFKLAKQWDCLVLMDHVDTVVEARSTADLERNAIVTGRLWKAHEKSFKMLMLGIYN